MNQIVISYVTYNNIHFIMGEFEGALCLVDFVTRESNIAIREKLQNSFNASFVEGESTILRIAKLQLDEYFKKVRTVFELPILFKGTIFQEQVWHALHAIPYGHTMSYKELAHTIGAPKAVRAVGTAVGSNRLSIILPCHRILTSSGEVGGYAGGAAIKNELLHLEQRNSHIY